MVCQRPASGGVVLRRRRHPEWSELSLYCCDPCMALFTTVPASKHRFDIIAASISCTPNVRLHDCTTAPCLDFPGQVLRR